MTGRGQGNLKKLKALAFASGIFHVSRTFACMAMMAFEFALVFLNNVYLSYVIILNKLFSFTQLRPSDPVTKLIDQHALLPCMPF